MSTIEDRLAAVEARLGTLDGTLLERKEYHLMTAIAVQTSATAHLT